MANGPRALTFANNHCTCSIIFITIITKVLLLYIMVIYYCIITVVQTHIHTHMLSLSTEVQIHYHRLIPLHVHPSPPTHTHIHAQCRGAPPLSVPSCDPHSRPRRAILRHPPPPRGHQPRPGGCANSSSRGTSTARSSPSSGSARCVHSGERVREEY